MGILYVVATPIGNLEDITLRALRVLREVDLIAAEDTRKTRKLLTHYDIRTPLTSYYGKPAKEEHLLTLLQGGKNIALVSEAGTPGISDPGYPLIKKAIEMGITVRSIPGPCAAIGALTVSGLPCDGFVFGGFLPRKKGKLLKRLGQLLSLGKTTIFYESPQRLLSTLQVMRENFPRSDVAVVRELTKKYEEVIRGNIGEVCDLVKVKAIKGEVIILVHPSPRHPSVPPND